MVSLVRLTVEGGKALDDRLQINIPLLALRDQKGLIIIPTSIPTFENGIYIFRDSQAAELEFRQEALEYATIPKICIKGNGSFHYLKILQAGIKVPTYLPPIQYTHHTLNDKIWFETKKVIFGEDGIFEHLNGWLSESMRNSFSSKNIDTFQLSKAL